MCSRNLRIKESFEFGSNQISSIKKRLDLYVLLPTRFFPCDAILSGSAFGSVRREHLLRERISNLRRNYDYDPEQQVVQQK